MNHRASRAKCHAGGGPLERRLGSAPEREDAQAFAATCPEALAARCHPLRARLPWRGMLWHVQHGCFKRCAAKRQEGRA